MKSIMSKMLVAVLIVCFLFAHIQNVTAESITGKSTGSVTFYVNVKESDAYIKLSSTKGLAVVNQHTANIPSGTGEEYIYGFYEITAVGPSGTNSIIWVPSATTNTQNANREVNPVFWFISTGIYKVTIRAMSNAEASSYWRLDSIKSWKNKATWKVADYYHCEVSKNNPASSSGGSGSFGGGGFSGGGSRGEDDSSNVIPQLPANSYTLWLKNSNVERIRPQCGPGYDYSVFASKNGSTKLYNPRNITYLSAKFCVGSWVYVEFGYTDGVLRYGFFEKSLFDSSVSWSSIPSYSLNFEKHGTINQTTVPYNGPGTYCGSYESCKLYSGNTVHACMECDGWYLCRFYNNHSNNYGDVYLWVPGYSISW